MMHRKSQAGYGMAFLALALVGSVVLLGSWLASTA